MRMEWLTVSAGPASRRGRRPAEALGKYITTYIVLTMRHRSPHPTVIWISWARERQRKMAPIPGAADGVAPAAGAYRAGGARGQGRPWLRLSRRSGAGDGGRRPSPGRYRARAVPESRRREQEKLRR